MALWYLSQFSFYNQPQWNAHYWWIITIRALYSASRSLVILLLFGCNFLGLGFLGSLRHDKFVTMLWMLAHVTLHIHLIDWPPLHMDHTLEITWWPTAPVVVTELPESSRSFFRNTSDPNVLSIQIGHTSSFLPSKWRPIFCVIDICQLHALSEALQPGQAQAKRHSKLVIWYDRLRFHVVLQAENNNDTKDWMPDSVHRFLVRVQVGKWHSPTALAKAGEDLFSWYSKIPPWSYGEWVLLSETIILWTLVWTQISCHGSTRLISTGFL